MMGDREEVEKLFFLQIFKIQITKMQVKTLKKREAEADRQIDTVFVFSLPSYTSIVFRIFFTKKNMNSKSYAHKHGAYNQKKVHMRRVTFACSFSLATSSNSNSILISFLFVGVVSLDHLDCWTPLD